MKQRAQSKLRTRPLTYEFKSLRPRKRLKELMLHVASSCDSDPYFSSTKLNKILYWSDFKYYLRTGRSITGAAYQRLPHGPAPKHLLPVRQELIDKDEARVQRIRRIDYLADKLIPLREPDLSIFSAEEIALVDQVIRELWGKTARNVSLESHGKAWEILKNRQSIPYEMAFLSDATPTATDIQRAQELATEHGWVK